jgi:hypothetical protein
MDFQTATTNFLQNREAARNSGEISANTFRVCKIHALRLTKHFGAVDLADVRNGLVKTYVDGLKAEGLSSASIVAIYGVLKQIVSSVVDADLEPLFTQDINAKRVKLPRVKAKEQHCATSSDVERALALDFPICALLAASGVSSIPNPL